MIPKSGDRFPAFAKPASAGEGRSDKIMHKTGLFFIRCIRAITIAEADAMKARPIEALNGHYIFADFIDGNIWSIPIAQVAPGTTIGSDRFVLRRADFTPNAGAIVNPICFGFDQAGNVYIVDFGGSIFRIDAG